MKVSRPGLRREWEFRGEKRGPKSGYGEGENGGWSKSCLEREMGSGTRCKPELEKGERKRERMSKCGLRRKDRGKGRVSGKRVWVREGVQGEGR